MKILETLRSIEMISTRYTVGALAKATDTKAVTIRYYEQVGDYYARFHVDPKRPDWMPMVGAL